MKFILHWRFMAFVPQRSFASSSSTPPYPCARGLQGFPDGNFRIIRRQFRQFREVGRLGDFSQRLRRRVADIRCVLEVANRPQQGGPRPAVADFTERPSRGRAPARRVVQVEQMNLRLRWIGPPVPRFVQVVGQDGGECVN